MLISFKLSEKQDFGGKLASKHNGPDLLAPFTMWWPWGVQRRLLCAGEHVEYTKGAKSIQRGPNLEKAPVQAQIMPNKSLKIVKMCEILSKIVRMTTGSVFIGAFSFWGSLHVQNALELDPLHVLIAALIVWGVTRSAYRYWRQFEVTTLKAKYTH